MSWVHLHLALNHVPVLGPFFVALLLMTATIRRNEELLRISLWAFLILSVVSIPIKFTGDFAYDEVRDAQWMPSEIAESHEQAADQATTGVFLLGVVAVIGLFVSRKHQRVPLWVTALLLALSLVTFALMARAANLGGQLRHEEIRPVEQVGGDQVSWRSRTARSNLHGDSVKALSDSPLLY